MVPARVTPCLVMCPCLAWSGLVVIELAGAGAGAGQEICALLDRNGKHGTGMLFLI